MALDAQALAIVQRLVEYLRDHPRAADGAEGIAVWWLSDYSLINTTQLAAALTWMQQYRLIETVKAADGRVRYRRVPTLVDIEAALRAALQEGA